MLKILKSFTFVITSAMIIASIFGLDKGISLLCLCFGLKELIYAKEYHDVGNARLSLISVTVGICVCICAVLSFVNII